MRRRINYIIIVIACLLSACENPINNDIIESTAKAESNHMEVNTMTLKPITEYPTYWEMHSGSIWGIKDDYPASKPEEVPLYDENDKKSNIDEFFTSNGKIYLKVVKMIEVEKDGEKAYEEEPHYFSQAEGEITEIDESEYPDKPESTHYTGDLDGYQITTDEYDNATISRVAMDHNPAGDELFYLVDNAHRGNGGLFISVIEGRGSVRTTGLWYWPFGKTSLQKVKGAGRLW